MRIQPNSTPIVIGSSGLQAPEAPARPSEAPAHGLTVPKPLAAEPKVVNIVGARVELHPNELAKVIDKLNETARIFNHTMRFEVKEGHRIQVKIIDITSGQVVREVPPDKIMDTYARVQDLIGLMIDERA